MQHSGGGQLKKATGPAWPLLPAEALRQASCVARVCAKPLAALPQARQTAGDNGGYAVSRQAFPLARNLTPCHQVFYFFDTPTPARVGFRLCLSIWYSHAGEWRLTSDRLHAQRLIRRLGVSVLRALVLSNRILSRARECVWRAVAAGTQTAYPPLQAHRCSPRGPGSGRCGNGRERHARQSTPAGEHCDDRHAVGDGSGNSGAGYHRRGRK